MRTFWRVGVPATLLALLAGCMANVPGGFVSHKLTQEDSAKMGMMTGSLSTRRNERVFANHSLLIRRVGAKEEEASVVFNPMFDDFPSELQERSYKGTAFAMKLPEGRYEIFNFQFIQVGALGSSRQFKGTEEFSIPFTIAAGRATYLGAYVMRPIIGRSLIGIRGTAGAYFEVDDQMARDLAAARQRWPEFDFTTVVSNVPDVDKIAHPLFVRPGQSLPTTDPGNLPARP